MSKRTQNNIGQTQKTSVKVHHGPGGQSSFSLGWGDDNNTKQSGTFDFIQLTSIITKVALSQEEKMKDKMNKKRKDLSKRERKKRNN